MKIFSESLAVELPETDESYESVRKRFLEGMKDDNVVVVAVHRRNWSEGPLVTARGIGFNVWAKALEIKCNGDHNLRFGWYGSNKKSVERIFDCGFSFRNLFYKKCAVLLSAENFPSLSVKDSVPDEDGLRHMLLCKVVLGKYELVLAGSGLTGPSSDEFDSGVDSCDNPKKYVIWGTHVNTQIKPEFVVTFKVKPPQNRVTGVSIKTSATTPTRMPKQTVFFRAIIQPLEKYLTPDAISLIKKFHKDCIENKIAKREFVHKLLQVAGEKLVRSIVSSYIEGNKFVQEHKTPISLLQHRNFSSKKEAIRRPKLTTVQFSTVVAKAMENCSDPDAIAVWKKGEKDYEEKKVLPPELRLKLKHIAGIELLKAVALSILKRRNRKP